MKVLVVDDEKPARDRMRRLLQGLSEVERIDEARDGRDALEQVSRCSPDLVLVDIRMPVMDGLEFGRHLSRLQNPPAIVFVTAYEQHALEAFELNAVDYLLKPVRPERLEQALRRVSPVALDTITQLQDGIAGDTSRRYISAHARGQITLVPVPEILFFVADTKYVRLRTVREQHLIEESLTALEKEFSGRFLRIHRNALAALAHVDKLKRSESGHWRVCFRDIEETLDISRRHTAAVKRALAESPKH